MKRKLLIDLNTMDAPVDDSAAMIPKKASCRECQGHFVEMEMSLFGFCRWCAMALKSRRFLNALSAHARVMGVLK